MLRFQKGREEGLLQKRNYLRWPADSHLASKPTCSSGKALRAAMPAKRQEEWRLETGLDVRINTSLFERVGVGVCRAAVCLCLRPGARTKRKQRGAQEQSSCWCVSTGHRDYFMESGRVQFLFTTSVWYHKTNERGFASDWVLWYHTLVVNKNCTNRFLCVFCLLYAYWDVYHSG